MEKKNTLKLILATAILFTVILSCNNSNSTNDESSDSAALALLEALDSIPLYDFNNCPKAWSLQELEASPDSFCMLAMFGEGGKYLTEFPEMLKDAPYLRGIDARRNLITRIPEFLSKLEDLDLGENKLKKCPEGLGNLKNLKILKLDDNLITALDETVFNLKGLEQLWLSNNKIKEIPSRLCNMSDLKVLSLTRNSISKLPSNIGQLAQLEKLYLNDQAEPGISSLPDALGKLKKLTHLYIGSSYTGGGYGNSLTELPACIFQLDSLKELNLTYGQILEIPAEIGKLKNLEALYLTGNKLTTLPEEIKKLKKLTSLYLGNNQISIEEQERIHSWFGDQVYVEFEEEVGD